MRRLVEASHGHKKIILYSVPGKEGFYRKLGFMHLLTAMAIFDDPQRRSSADTWEMPSPAARRHERSTVSLALERFSPCCFGALRM